MNSKALYAASVAGLILTLFPFACASEGACFGEFRLWRYLVYFAVFGAFFSLGRLAAELAKCRDFGKRRGRVMFASRAAVVIPAGAFIAAVALAGFPTGLYFYIFPACIIAYYGGHHTAGFVYSDVFSRGWFVLFFVTALVCSATLWFTHDEGIMSAGGFQLCFCFGVIIVLAAVLTNQTNIDMRTAQRDAGRSVLPAGLRSYNALLIAAICLVTVGLFLFAKPLAKLIGEGISALLGFILSLIKNEGTPSTDEPSFEHSEEQMKYSFLDGIPAELLNALLFVFVAGVVFCFRHVIWELIKGALAPLFAESAAPDEVPFVDEVSDARTRSDSFRTKKKSEQQLLKRYKKESDPVAKYRMGYALFLRRLERSPFAPTLTDTTTAHSKKGASAFRREDIDVMVSVYNDVRYGGRVPTAQELSAQERIIDELK
ncbi:MAG: DUF4129 domain-containing protein [Oscillospiraceae bacterium]